MQSPASYVCVKQLMGIEVEPVYGGPGSTFTASNLVIEELSKVDGSTGLICDVSNSIFVPPLRQYGTKQQKEKYLPRAVTDSVSKQKS